MCSENNPKLSKRSFESQVSLSHKMVQRAQGVPIVELGGSGREHVVLHVDPLVVNSVRAITKLVGNTNSWKGHIS